MLHRTSSFAFAGSGLFALAVACSSSSSTGGGGATTPCNEDPWQCPSGQTCWPNASESGFECLDSVSGTAPGATCADYAGMPTCGDGQFCFTMTGTNGSCDDYCDPTMASHGCPVGYACAKVIVGSAGDIQICVPTSSGDQDSGVADSSSGG